jgi:3-hydroxyacyl-CoA dehydrogenase
MDTLRLAVIGDGKMGRAVASLAPDAGFDVVAVLGEAELLPNGISGELLRRQPRESFAAVRRPAVPS